MKKTKSMNALGKQVLGAQACKAIVGGATHREIIIHGDGTREVWTYRFTDSNGNGIWDSNESRVLVSYVFLNAVQ